MNNDWKEAIDVLAAAALAAGISGRSYDLRVAILHRFYGSYQSYRQIALALSGDNAPVDDGTVARNGKEMKAWLGAKEGGDNSETRDGIEPMAFMRATELLQSAGLLTG